MVSADIAIRVDALRYRYSRAAPDVLLDVGLEVAAGTTVGLVGESGSGKSTLGRIIVDERRPSAGTVMIEGRSWAREPRRGELRRAVQMIFQDPYSALNPYMTPLVAVAEAAGVTETLPRRARRDRAVELLEQVGLRGTLIERTPAALSGGQRQRVVIARALACRPRILVADEATSALDVSVQAQILNLLMRLQAELGLTILIISHDMAVINHVTDRVAVLQRGRIVEEGETESIMRSPSHPYTKELIAAFDDHPLATDIS